MQGMKFLLLDGNGQPINHGIISQRVTDERYLCTFLRTPPSSRLVHVDEIATWNLFPDDDTMNAFILGMQAETGKPQKPVETPPAPLDDPDPPPPPPPEEPPPVVEWPSTNDDD